MNVRTAWTAVLAAGWMIGCVAEGPPGTEGTSEASLRSSCTGLDLTCGQCGDFNDDGLILYEDWELYCTGGPGGPGDPQTYCELHRRDVDRDRDFDEADCDLFWNWYLGTTREQICTSPTRRCGSCADLNGDGTVNYGDWEEVCTGAPGGPGDPQTRCELHRRDIDQDGDFDQADCDTFWNWYLYGEPALICLPPSCDTLCGDMNGDGTVNYGDWEEVCTGAPGGPGTEQSCCNLSRRDVDRDGDFDEIDCSTFWSWWLDGHEPGEICQY